MKKTLLKQLTIVTVFLVGSWFVLSSIDWMKVLKVDAVENSIDQNLGEKYWEVFSENLEQVKDPIVVEAVDSIIKHICDKNEIDFDQLKIHIVEDSEINAFAFPNKHLVIYTGLIKECSSEFELAGVIAHEIAHIQLNHAMEMLIKEVGLQVLMSITTGGAGGEVLSNTLGLLTSKAFSRQMEEEADLMAIDYLKEANINPAALAEFLYKLSNDESEWMGVVSTHPLIKDRVAYVLEKSKNSKISSDPILSDSTFTVVQNQL